jgi:hypothetical protein
MTSLRCTAQRESDERNVRQHRQLSSSAKLETPHFHPRISAPDLRFATAFKQADSGGRSTSKSIRIRTPDSPYVRGHIFSVGTWPWLFTTMILRHMLLLVGFQPLHAATFSHNVDAHDISGMCYCYAYACYQSRCDFLPYPRMSSSRASATPQD